MRALGAILLLVGLGGARAPATDYAPSPDRPNPAARGVLAGPTAEAKPAHGAYAIQVAAAVSDGGAHDELAKISKVLTRETRALSQVVVRTTVNGKLYYRAIFSGITDEASAQTLCQTVSRLGNGCVVRKL